MYPLPRDAFSAIFPRETFCFPAPDAYSPGIPALADDAPFCLAFSFLFPFCQYTDSFLLPFCRQDFYCLPAPAGFPDSRRNPLYLAYMDFSYPSRLPCSSLYTRHTVSQSPQCRCLPALCILTGFLPVNGFYHVCSRQTAYLILETMFRNALHGSYTSPQCCHGTYVMPTTCGGFFLFIQSILTPYNLFNTII